MSDVTDEQIGAVKLLTHPRVYYSMTMEEQDALKVVLGMLPESVKNPLPALPTDRGLYVDQRGEGGSVWRIERNGGPMHREGGSDQPAPDLGPFTRLVPERPPVLPEQIDAISDQSHSWDETVLGILTLVNGTHA